jgi:hypothetical protein
VQRLRAKWSPDSQTDSQSLANSQSINSVSSFLDLDRGIEKLIYSEERSWNWVESKAKTRRRTD